MIAAAHVADDLAYVVHLLAALAALVVLVSLRLSAHEVASGHAETAARRFPDRTDWAARVVHLLPLSGLAIVGTGPATDSLGHAWVVVGLVGYFVAAFLLEARALPAERELARALASGEDPTALARRLAGRIDSTLAVLAVVAVVMVVRP